MAEPVPDQNKFYSESISVQSGYITGKTECVFHVACGDETYHAITAASCLLSAEVGDKVVIICMDELAWIVNILCKKNTGHNRINLPGSLSIITQDTMELRGKQAVNIVSDTHMQVLSKTIGMDIKNAEIRCDTIGFFSRLVNMHVEIISQVAERVEQVARQLICHLGQRFCTVKNHDEQRSGSYRALVKDDITIESDNYTQRSKRHVTIDGEKIHLG